MAEGKQQYKVVKTKLRAALVSRKGETWVDQLLELMSTGYTACERRQGCIGGLWNLFHTGAHFNGSPPKMPSIFRRTFEASHSLRNGKCIACNKRKMVDEHGLGLQCHYTMECAAYLLHSLHQAHPDFVDHADYIFTALHTYKADTCEYFANYSRTTSSGDTVHHVRLPSFDTSNASSFWQEDDDDEEDDDEDDEDEEDDLTTMQGVSLRLNRRLSQRLVADDDAADDDDDDDDADDADDDDDDDDADDDDADDVDDDDDSDHGSDDYEDDENESSEEENESSEEENESSEEENESSEEDLGENERGFESEEDDDFDEPKAKRVCRRRE
jgi:hypothetical protein